jgi:hypothetical protein
VSPTENSIALKKRAQHPRGNEFLGLRKHLSNRRVVNDPPYRLPEQRITAEDRSILKRKRLTLPVVRIGGVVKSSHLRQCNDSAHFWRVNSTR